MFKMCELHHKYKDFEKSSHKECHCASNKENHEKYPDCKCMTNAEHKYEHTCCCKGK